MRIRRAAGFKILDIKIIGGHYEETLKHLRRAFFVNIAMHTVIVMGDSSACRFSFFLAVSVFLGHNMLLRLRLIRP